MIEVWDPDEKDLWRIQGQGKIVACHTCSSGHRSDWCERETEAGVVMETLRSVLRRWMVEETLLENWRWSWHGHVVWFGNLVPCKADKESGALRQDS